MIVEDPTMITPYLPFFIKTMIVLKLIKILTINNDSLYYLHCDANLTLYNYKWM